MKKNLFTLLMVLGCIGLFTACSSSDSEEDNNGGSGDEVTVEGAWKVNTKDALDSDWEPEDIKISLDIIPLLEGFKDGKNDVVLSEFQAKLKKEGKSTIDLTTGAIAELVESYGSAGIAEELKTVIFDEDSNIRATYDGATTASPKGLATYKLGKASTMSVQLYAAEIIKEADVDANVGAILKKVLHRPFTVVYDLDKKEKTLECGLDKEGLQDALLRITDNIEDILNLIPEDGVDFPAAVLAMIPDTAKPMVPNKIPADVIKNIVNQIMTQLPDVLDKTTEFNLELNLMK